ncbi:hypothetical protein, partial [Enterobacter sichuanensis]
TQHRVARPVFCWTKTNIIPLVIVKKITPRHTPKKKIKKNTHKKILTITTQKVIVNKGCVIKI